MTNKELLKKLIVDKPINIRFLEEYQIYLIIQKLGYTFNIRKNCNSAILQGGDFHNTFGNYDYIYFSKNSRTIRKGNFKGIYPYTYISYRELNVLMHLLDENYNLELLMKQLENEEI